ncbi:DnaD domain protein [Clostridium sp. YIM B02505]|uniref:DnaD domain protein n=1 Tax=Clostridium yunnanense TaxID=2800325 RepID=A0ABS1END9_9CLOT|nr:DnaD domain protein [Clostridium yunnanense]MBK1810882.1 DnaD domain protein [Clostridium yunnanense]
MSTFMLKNSPVQFTPVSNIFLERYMPKARGEFVKVYLMMLKYSISGELGVSSSIIASNLNLLESDIMNALNYWHDEGIIQLVPIDKMNNFNIKFMELSGDENTESTLNLLDELNKNNTKDMLKEVERLLARPLSPKEMSTYLGLQNDFSFSSEMILMLIEYCVSKGKADSRYIEKVALAWHDSGIKNIEDVHAYITKSEDKWIKIRKILAYLGIKNAEVMKPQEELMEKWMFTYNFSNEVILKACEICFERLNRADFRYIDGILTRWNNDGIKTLEDVATKNLPSKTSNNRSNNNSNNYDNGKKSNLKFTDYEQRTYDYDSLERKLLGWDNND